MDGGDPRVYATIRDIAATLGRPDDSWWPDTAVPTYRTRLAASLAHGNAGLAVALAYAAAALDDAALRDTAVTCLNSALDEVARTPMRPVLFEGLAGIAWAAQHCACEGLLPGESVPEEEIDDALAGLLEGGADVPFDLIAGATGIGVYGLERRTDSSPRLLSATVDWLAARAEPMPHGVAWRTLPQHGSENNRRKAPHGYFDAGLAHGTPGVIAFLAAAAERVPGDRADELLAAAVEWLLSVEPCAFMSRYPAIIAPGVSEPTRLAWCYGDLGVASALWRAGVRLGREDVLASARALALAAARRPAAQSGVVDASFCHGAAGLTFLFQTWYSATGDEVFRDAATTWLERIFQWRGEGGVAGFSYSYAFVDFDGTAEHLWTANPGLLNGAAGIALALVAAASSHPPGWARLFLIDLPAEPQRSV